LGNKDTGNTALVLDHSDLFRGTGRDPKKIQQIRNMWSKNWNFGMHGKHIASALSQVDSLARGITLHFGLNPGATRLYGENSRTMAWAKHGNTTLIHMGTRKLMPDYEGRVSKLPSYMRYPEDPLGVKATVTHELGHVLSIRNAESAGYSLNTFLLKHYVPHVMETALKLTHPVRYEDPGYNLFDLKTGTRAEAEQYRKNMESASSQQERENHTLEFTSPTLYGRTSWSEHYAEMFETHHNPRAILSSRFLEEVARHQGWSTDSRLKNP
jgi:hypothetical protein